MAAVQAATRELDGAYALAVISRDAPDTMVCARMGCPLLVGLGEGENFVASDVSAILQATRRVIFLEEGDTAVLTRAAVQVFDGAGDNVVRILPPLNVTSDEVREGLERIEAAAQALSATRKESAA